MESAKALPALGFRGLGEGLGQLNLSSKSQLLRDKVKLLRGNAKAPAEVLQQIDSHLNAISQESTPLKQWNHYELAYEEYISAAAPEDLLGALLNLQISAHLLDAPSQAVWSGARMAHLEQEIRQGNASPVLREEIASLARAIHQDEMHRRRYDAMKRGLFRIALFLSTALAIVTIALLVLFQTKRVTPGSPWQIVLISCLGASGALLTSYALLARTPPRRDDLQKERMGMYFQATVGAIVGVMVALFLQLRIIDFPFLHLGAADTTPFAPAALYVFAFASGCLGRLFF